MQKQWRSFLLGWLIILIGSVLAHSIQTSGDIRIKDVRFNGADGNVLSAYLYIPPGVTASHPRTRHSRGAWLYQLPRSAIRIRD